MPEKLLMCGGFVCDGQKTGKCPRAQEVIAQAQYGSTQSVAENVWERPNWEAFIKRMKRDVLPVCAHPDQLGEVLNSTKPTFAEDVQDIEPKNNSNEK